MLVRTSLSSLLSLLTPHDVLKDSLVFAAFTSPWAVLASLNWTIIFGGVNLLVLSYFRWRTLKLRERELELNHEEEKRALRQRLSAYERVEQPPRRERRAGWRDRLALLPRHLRARGALRDD